MLRLLLKIWNYSSDKSFNLPFLAICHSQFPFLIFLVSSWYKKAKIALWTSFRKNKNLVNKETIWRKKDCHFKGIYEIKSTFSRANVFPLSLLKAFVKFEKLIRFHHQVFIIPTNGENLKTLIEIFRQKLKPKMFLVAQPWWPT